MGNLRFLGALHAVLPRERENHGGWVRQRIRWHDARGARALSKAWKTIEAERLAVTFGSGAGESGITPFVGAIYC